jgi:hypothetical protein
MHEDPDDEEDVFEFAFGFDNPEPRDGSGMRPSGASTPDRSPLSLPGPIAYIYPVAVVVTDTEPVSIALKFPGAEPFTLTVSESDYPTISRAFAESIAYADAFGEPIDAPGAHSEPFRES